MSMHDVKQQNEKKNIICIINCCISFFNLAFFRFLLRNVPVMTVTIPCFFGKVCSHKILLDCHIGKTCNECSSDSLSPPSSPLLQAEFIPAHVLFSDC